MLHKKKCICGYVVSGTSANAVGDAIKDHGDYKGCNVLEARNV